MMNRAISLLTVAFFMGLAVSAQARRAAPPEEVWGQSSNAAYEFKTETRTGQVTVYKSGDREKALWRVRIPQFGTFYSKVALSSSGDYLLHIRGNHQVSKLEDVGIQLFTDDGYISESIAKDFIDALVVTKQRTSIDPRFKWLNRVELLTADSFTVINAKDEKTVVLLKELKMKKAE